MSYCRRCGSYMPMSETTCPACGFQAADGKAAQGAGQTGQYQTQSERPKDSRYDEPWTRRPDRNPWEDAGAASTRRSYGRTYGGAKDRPGEQAQDWRPWVDFSAGSATTEERHLCILCYLGPLFIIPFLLKKNSPFVRFHVNQGLLLFLAGIAFQIARGIVPFFGWAVGLGGSIFWLVCFIRGLSGALNGNMTKLPFIGDITLIK